jgi:hypothetical protein
MAKSINVDKKRGRPATGHDPAVSIRIPQYFIDETDAWAKATSVSRAEAFRKIIEMGLAARSKKATASSAPAKKAKR